MAKFNWILSCSALISLSGTMPASAFEITQEQVAELQDHWRLCHPNLPVPEDSRLLRYHGPLYDEDHFELFMQQVHAHSCADDPMIENAIAAAAAPPPEPDMIPSALAGATETSATEIEE